MQQTWQQQNIAAIRARLDWLRGQPDGPLYDERSALHRIQIIKQAGQVQFFFIDPDTGELDGPMSRIALDQPLQLLAEYTQVAALTLLWRAEPARICLLGLAGGRLSMFFHHYLPQAQIDNVDIDPDVAAIAERFFGLAFDQRQRLHTQDARAYLEGCDTQYDTIIMDAFRDSTDELAHLATSEFYQLCQARLARGGVLCVNLLRSDRLFREKSRTLLESFRYASAIELKRSVVLFGHAHPPLGREQIARRAAALERAHDLAFVARAGALQPARALPFYSARALRDAGRLTDTGIRR